MGSEMPAGIDPPLIIKTRPCKEQLRFLVFGLYEVQDDGIIKTGIQPDIP
jgi:hypothetical protein